MPRRPRRDFDALTEAQLLAGRTTARRIDPDRIARASVAAPRAQGVADLLDAIALVAEAATGDRSFLHLKAPPQKAAPGPSPAPPDMAVGAEAHPSPLEAPPGEDAPVSSRAGGDQDGPGD
ncbi:hypothetical protein [Methylobacterium planeticum]|uniref:hypothetical protein n=1 Tax=Methylobacterium planeticum TaxID=2615211 RepID=UPI001FEE6D73|nr:hypothetical protein [Methylobacterium planeticum]